MSELPPEIFWNSLETPIPKSMEFIPNARVEMSQLEKQNQLLKAVLVGLGIIAVGAVIYFLYKSNQDEKRKTR
jgi:hypothetical protein